MAGKTDWRGVLFGVFIGATGGGARLMRPTQWFGRGMLVVGLIDLCSHGLHVPLFQASPNSPTTRTRRRAATCLHLRRPATPRLRLGSQRAARGFDSRQPAGLSGMSMLAGAFLTRGAFARLFPVFCAAATRPSKSRSNCSGVAAFATDFMGGLLTAFFRAISDTYRVTITCQTRWLPGHLQESGATRLKYSQSADARHRRSTAPALQRTGTGRQSRTTPQGRRH
jgi:hypothetical protein